MGEDSDMFLQTCEKAEGLRVFPYSFFAMVAMFLYYVLLMDMAVFSTRVSAYVLACGRMLAEVGLFLLGLFCCILTFSSALSCLNQKLKEFHGIPNGAFAMFKMLMNVFDTNEYKSLEDEPVVMMVTVVYIIATYVFLMNMLIAQLACSYGSTYQDMVGFARLRRIKLIVETMPSVSHKNWISFLNGLKLDQRLEFNEGDVGLAGGIQVTEPASAHPTTVDMIKRFGGSTSPSIQWPEEDGAGDDDTDKFDRLEALIKKTMERITKEGVGGGGRKGKGASSSGMGGSGDGAGGGSGGGSEEGSNAGDEAADADAAEDEEGAEEE